MKSAPRDSVSLETAVQNEWPDELDPRPLRTGDIRDRRVDAALARHELGWKPEVDFTNLVRMMVRADVEACAR